MSLLGDLTGGVLSNGIEGAYNPIGALKDSAGTASNTFQATKNPMTALSGGTPTLDTSASDTYAALTQQQWQNYVSTFVPVENQLINYATDKTQPAQAMAQASTDVNNAYGVQAGEQQRLLQGEGVTLNPTQQAAATRATGLSQSLANVQGQNVAHDLTISNQQSILGNPAPTTSQIATQATALGS